MPKAEVAVVDGMNAAYVEQSDEGKPSVASLLAVVDAVRDEGMEPVVVVDASLVHEIDEPEALERLIDDQAVRQAPADTDADYFVLQFAEDLDALVVSNDLFQDRRERFPWIEQRRVPFMVVRGRAQLYLPKERTD